MNLHTPRIAKVGLAVFALVSIGLFWLLLGSFGGPTLHPHAPLRTQVVVDDAGGIPQHADVLVHGVKVGVVSRVSAVGARTRLDLELVRSEAPALHSDASVRIAAKTPLGESFVDLDPGHAPGRAGDTLRARPAVEVDEALRALDPAARRDVRGLLGTGDRALRSPAAAARVGATVHGLGATVDAIDQVATTLAGQADDISATVRDAHTVFGALAARDADISATVRAARTTLAATAAQRASLGAAVALLPGLEREARATLDATHPLVREALPVVSALQDASPDLARALRALPATLSDLDAVLLRGPALQRAAKPALAAVRALAPVAVPALERLSPALANAVPMLRYLSARRDTIAAWFSNTADLGSNGDAKGKWARFFIMIDPATTLGIKAGAPPGNAYTQPHDGLQNQPYKPGDFPRLLPYAPALG